MSDRDELAEVIHAHVWGDDYPADEAECCADAILSSDWLARVKREAKAQALEEAATPDDPNDAWFMINPGWLLDRAAKYRAGDDQ